MARVLGFSLVCLGQNVSAVLNRLAPCPQPLNTLQFNRRFSSSSYFDGLVCNFSHFGRYSPVSCPFLLFYFFFVLTTYYCFFQYIDICTRMSASGAHGRGLEFESVKCQWVICALRLVLSKEPKKSPNHKGLRISCFFENYRLEN